MDKIRQFIKRLDCRLLFFIVAVLLVAVILVCAFLLTDRDTQGGTSTYQLLIDSSQVKIAYDLLDAPMFTITAVGTTL